MGSNIVESRFLRVSPEGISEHLNTTDDKEHKKQNDPAKSSKIHGPKNSENVPGQMGGGKHKNGKFVHSGNGPKESDDTDAEKADDKSEEDDEDDTFYDGKGWHLNENDLISKVIHPEKLQPYWFIPIVIGIKVLFTSVAFGFSFATKETKDEGCVGEIKKIGKSVAQIAFCVMALNGYFRDYKRVVAGLEMTEGWFDYMCVVTSVWVTSPNLASALAVWNDLRQFNPGKLLVLQKKGDWVQIPILGIPLVPGWNRQWLTFGKHCFAILLFPYWVLSELVLIALLLLRTGVECAGCCKIPFMICCATLKCECSLLGVIFTLGLVGWCRDSLHFWWGNIWPVMYGSLVLVWSFAVVPPLVGGLYACKMGMPKLLQPQEAGGTEKSFQEVMVAAQVLSKEERAEITRLNHEKLADEWDVASGEHSPLSGSGPVDLSNARYKMFSQVTLSAMQLLVLQYLVIMSSRAASAEDVEEYVGAIYITVTERTIRSYVGSLYNIGEESGHHLSEFVNRVVWDIL